MGRMPANPFFRTAWDALKIQALKIFAEELRKEIYAAARRLAKKAERGKLTTRQIQGLTR
jgi:DNA invertase Pin-like site-specific DNA recombinase